MRQITLQVLLGHPKDVYPDSKRSNLATERTDSDPIKKEVQAMFNQIVIEIAAPELNDEEIIWRDYYEWN